MDAEDRAALIALYSKAAGHAWDKNRGWCTDKPLADWDGVSVDDQGRVVRLNLSDNNLVGSIPKELGSLHHLQVLKLSGNKLTGSIPKELGSLHRLQELKLSVNKLTGAIPKQFGALKNLRICYLAWNQLSGRIPKQLGLLHQLQELKLSGNKFTGQIPRVLGSLHNLEELKLSRNKLTGAIPKELGGLSRLKTCILDSNQFSGAIPRELGYLHNLKELNLSGNKLTGTIPKELGKLRRLRVNSLGWNQLRGGIPRELGSMQNLQDLDLSGNMLTGAIPEELGELENLRICYLASNQLSGGIPRELGSLHKLQDLDISRNKLTGTVPAQLVKLCKLEDLRLVNNNFEGQVPSLKQLKDLYVALADEDSGNKEYFITMTAGVCLEPANKVFTMIEDSTLRPGTTHKWGSNRSHEPTMSGVGMKPVSKMPTRTAESPVYSRKTSRQSPRQFLKEARTGLSTEQFIEVTRRIEGFDGDVMAWSFGASSGVIGCPDFEFQVPDLGRDVPALIGQSSSLAEVIDGDFCLLHPVVTCLSRSGGTFSPPLLLRFPVGHNDSMEAGSDVGSSDGDEESYHTYLKSRYSTVKREEGSVVWVPTSGEIVQMDNGIFVLETQVSHFTDYALKQNVDVDPGDFKIVPIKKLPHESRRNVFLFVNQGDETIVVHCWRRPTKRFWISRMMASFGFASVEVGGSVERGILEHQSDEVYSKVLQPTGRPTTRHSRGTIDMRLPDASLDVAWATQEEGDGHLLVNVWGRCPMDHKTALVIGPLQDHAYASVRNLRVANGLLVGNEVRATLEKRRKNF